MFCYNADYLKFSPTLFTTDPNHAVPSQPHGLTKAALHGESLT